MARLTCLLVAALGAGLALPAGASAWTVSMSGGVATFAGGGGEVNTLSVSADASQVLFTETSSGTALAPCSKPQANVAACPLAGLTAVDVLLGDLDDDLTMAAGVPGRTLDGGPGNDTITGSSSPESLTGGPGHDALHGGGGDDFLTPGIGDDAVQGGTGTDEVSYSERTASVVVSINNAGGDGEPGLAEDDNVNVDVERLRSGSGNDTLSASNVANLIDAGPGDDTVMGLAGDDRIGGGDGVDVIHAGEGADMVFGNAAADQLFGDGGNDELSGGPGPDQLDGGDGDDLLGDADVIDAGGDQFTGGPGADTLTYRHHFAGPVHARLDGLGGHGADGENDTIGLDVENLTGGQMGDVLYGDDGPNVIDGGPGNDRLDGLGGPDTLIGGDGDDTLTTRDGIAEPVDCGAGGDSVVGDANDVLSCETADVQLATADWTLMPGAPFPGETVQLTSLGGDPDSTVVERSWDLDGDGDYDDALGPTASAVAPSTPFVLGHRVVSSDGSTAVVRRTVPVSVPPPPVATPSPTPTPAPEPVPVLAETLVVRTDAGRVTVRLPGSTRFLPVSEVREVPVGALLDARGGRVELRGMVDRRGQMVRGEFGGARFRIGQSRAGVVEVRLADAATGCRRARSSAKREPRLAADAVPGFAVRGTQSRTTPVGPARWTTENGCLGTVTRVQAGRVNVRDLVARRTVRLRKGQRHVARPRRGGR